MANWDHVKIVKQGAAVLRAFREKNPEIRIDLNLADLRESDLDGMDLNSVDLRMADLRGANLKMANLFRANLTEANLGRANLSMADVRRCNLTGADLGEANLTGTDLSKADLSRAKLIGATLLGANLREAEMPRAILIEANLAVASIIGANLNEADLSRANLIGADLNESRLTRADLGWADLSKTQLARADLTGAILLGANLTGADLRGANLTIALCGATVFAGIDLSDTMGLDVVRHLMPSTLGIDTIFASKGRIPEAFLRGTGVPKLLTDQLPALLMKPALFDTCFVSFIEPDVPFGEQLFTDLQKAGVRCWRWRPDVRWSGRRMGEVDEARAYDKLVMVCSEASLRSPGMLAELERALQREDELRIENEAAQILFPVSIDDYLFQGWQHRQKPYVVNKGIADFRKWPEPDLYRTALESLLKILSTETTAAGV